VAIAVKVRVLRGFGRARLRRVSCLTSGFAMPRRQSAQDLFRRREASIGPSVPLSMGRNCLLVHEEPPGRT
jgi:hypothetical protein